MNILLDFGNLFKFNKLNKFYNLFKFINANKIYNYLNNLIKSFIKLDLLHKLFIIFLLLIFVFFILKNFDKQDTIESFKDGKNKFSKNFDQDIYDKHYADHYDKIYLNSDRNRFEVDKIISLEKKNKYTKILDVGCGTGYTVELFNKKKYNVIGLDQSKYMIQKAKDTYPDCKFEKGNILNGNIFDYSTFTHITCLGKTIYEIKDKSTFFENCYTLLNTNGFLILHLIDKKKSSPYVQKIDKNVLFDPQKYNKNIDQLIVKFDKENEFLSKYKINKDDNNNLVTDKASPYIIYHEKFENFSNHNVKKYELKLYISDIPKIIELAKTKGFEFYERHSMDSIKYKNEYLYILKKI